MLVAEAPLKRIKPRKKKTARTRIAWPAELSGREMYVFAVTDPAGITGDPNDNNDVIVGNKIRIP